MAAADGKPAVFAIVPAAGRSRRMGRPKQLLEVGGRPMLLAVVEPLAAAGVVGVAVVTRRAVAARIDLTCFPCVFVAYNDNPRSAMIDSVRIGLRAWQALHSIADPDGFLVCPADHPGISTDDFDRCISVFQHAPTCVVVASHAGQPGHPIIFPAGLAPFVQSPACDAGLNQLPRSFPDRVIRVECRSRAVIRDLDRPGDLTHPA